MKKTFFVVILAIVILLFATSCMSQSQTPLYPPQSSSYELNTETDKNTSEYNTTESTASENRVYFDDFSIVLPDNWCYEEDTSGYSVVFYEKQVHEETTYGMIVGIAKYDQVQQNETMNRDYLGEHNGGYFYASSPSSPDVDTSDTELLNLWNIAYAQIEEVLATIEWNDSGDNTEYASNEILFGGYYLTVPENWVYEQDGDSVTFYEINNYNKGKYGCLMIIKEDSQTYSEDASGFIKTLGIENGVYFNAWRPTGVESYPDDMRLQDLYSQESAKIDSILTTFELKYDSSSPQLSPSSQSPSSSQSSSTTDISSMIIGSWVPEGQSVYDNQHKLTFRSDGTCDIIDESYSGNEKLKYYKIVNGNELLFSYDNVNYEDAYHYVITFNDENTMNFDNTVMVRAQ